MFNWFLCGPTVQVVVCFWQQWRWGTWARLKIIDWFVLIVEMSFSCWGLINSLFSRFFFRYLFLVLFAWFINFIYDRCLLIYHDNILLIYFFVFLGVLTSDFIVQFIFLMLHPIQRLSNIAELARTVASSDVCYCAMYICIYIL